MTRIANHSQRQVVVSLWRRKHLLRGCTILATCVSLHYLSCRQLLQDTASDLFLGTSSAATATSTQQQSSSSFPNIFKKTSGPGWEIWHDLETPLQYLETNSQQTSNITCKWTTYNAYQPPTTYLSSHTASSRKSNPVPFCIHDISSDRWVSGNILAQGRWRDCDVLTNWYYDSDEGKGQRSSSSSSTTPSDGWYIDIGANIGSCVIQVLMTTDANIIAFEPDPRNLFRLTSTLSQLPPELRKRVYVYPVALGAEQGTSEIHVAADNRGNAVVGKKIIDNGYEDQDFLEPLPIPIEVMDELLDVSRANIQLVKMDSQGYECYIVKGMNQFFKRTKTIVFEMEKIMLRSFPNCSEQVLWNVFEGFNKYSHKQGPLRQKTPISAMPQVDAVNLVAQRVPSIATTSY